MWAGGGGRGCQPIEQGARVSVNLHVILGAGSPGGGGVEGGGEGERREGKIGEGWWAWG